LTTTNATRNSTVRWPRANASAITGLTDGDLTDVVRSENNQSSMRFRNAAVRVLAFAIATTFSWSLWAACAEAAISTPSAQMACCKDGEFTCAPHGDAKDCCQTDAARPHEAVPGAKIDPVHTLTAVVAWAVLPDMSAAGLAHARFDTPTSPPHIDPGPPPYIAFSSLLI
jgi:hypothetical protein